MIVKCEYCGNEFEAQRSTARFCGDLCRMNHHNRIKRLERLPEAAIDAINEIYAIAQQVPEVYGKAFYMLDEIKRVLHNVEFNHFDYHRVLREERENVTES